MIPFHLLIKYIEYVPVIKEGNTHKSKLNFSMHWENCVKTRYTFTVWFFFFSFLHGLNDLQEAKKNIRIIPIDCLKFNHILVVSISIQPKNLLVSNFKQKEQTFAGRKKQQTNRQ